MKKYKPNSKNLYVRKAIETATVGSFTFCLIGNNDDPVIQGYIVRVVPHDDLEGFWLKGGPWETFSGAKASILNFLSDEFEE